MGVIFVFAGGVRFVYRAEVVYCQWQCTLLQTLTMTQPPGSHHPLHG